MNKLIAVTLLAASSVFAETSIFEEQTGMSQQEFMALLVSKYNRDMSNSAGRVSWHGRLVKEEIDTNTFTKVCTYADGASFTDRARIVRAIDSVKASNAKLSKTNRVVMTNGVPVRLANARILQSKNSSTVSNVTVSITAGK